jgi:hypothetical protein
MEGIQINLVSEDVLENMTVLEKIRFILDDVRDGNLIVLERGLTEEEQKTLIEMTMAEIDQSFSGIEIGSYPCKRKFKLLGKLLGKSITQRRLTLIGRADRLKTIKKDRNFISTVIIPK